MKNETPFRPVLRRADLTEGLCVGALVVRVEYRISPGGLVPWEGVREPLETDAPTTAEHAVWDGTSVTVAGSVRSPGCAPHVARVDLQVGAERRTLLVHGDRQWIRNAGRLVPSAPAPFERKPLSWALAFGGGYEMPPGLDPFRKIPHPGGPVAHPLNPLGQGFYRDEATAEGQPLPSITRPGDVLQRPEDQPRPAGFAPCPELAGLRLRDTVAPDPADAEWHLRAMLRFIHHAPGELVFEGLAPETGVSVSGVGAAPLAFSVPRSPLRVSTQRGKSREEVGFRVRAVHVSADDGAVIVEHAHAFGFAPGAAPAWVRVAQA